MHHGRNLHQTKSEMVIDQIFRAALNWTGCGNLQFRAVVGLPWKAMRCEGFFFPWLSDLLKVWPVTLNIAFALEGRAGPSLSWFRCQNQTSSQWISYLGSVQSKSHKSFLFSCSAGRRPRPELSAVPVTITAVSDYKLECNNWEIAGEKNTICF